MMIIVSIMISYARSATVNISTAKILSCYYLTSCRLNQRRASEKNCALLFHNNRLISHSRHIGAAGCTGTHYCRNLWDITGRHIGLIKKDTAEMFAIRKHLILAGQVGTA